MNKIKRCQNCSEEMDESEENESLCEDCAEEANMADEVLDENEE